MADQDVTSGFPNETTLADRYGAGVEKAGVRHTPGPWKVGEWSETLGYDCMTGGIRIGPIVLDGADYGQRHCQPIQPADKARLMADARLIAAAPDMLEALRAVDREATAMRYDDPLARLVRAVLAKATLPTPGGSDE